MKAEQITEMAKAYAEKYEPRFRKAAEQAYMDGMEAQEKRSRIKTVSLLRFVAWKNGGDPKAETAYALVEGHYDYFRCAINCMRDGDMGEKDERGIWSREWWGDSIWPEERPTMRPMTYEEVEMYMQYVDVQEEYGKDIIIIKGKESYAITGYGKHD